MKIILDIQIRPVKNQSGSSLTQHSAVNKSTNESIKILEGIINNKVNQILVYSQPYIN